MSVVIIGGHDRMVCQYKKICKEHKCKAKVFTQMPAKLSSQIGSPDLIILFTNTVSHKMVKCAVAEAEGNRRICQKPAGYDRWHSRRTACSIFFYCR